MSIISILQQKSEFVVHAKLVAEMGLLMQTSELVAKARKERGTGERKREKKDEVVGRSRVKHGGTSDKWGL